MNKLIVVALLALPGVAHAQAAFETGSTLAIAASKDAVLGRLLRFALRDQLKTPQDHFDETVRLKELRRDLDWVELEIEQGEIYTFRVHLADESRPHDPERAVYRVSARIHGSGRQRVSLTNFEKLVREVLTTPL